MRIISVDLGTTNIKGAFVEVDEESRTVNVLGSINVRQQAIEDPRAGVHEHNPHYVIRTIKDVIRHLSSTYGQPDAMAFDSYNFVHVFVSKTGEYLSNLITYLDERPKIVLDDIKNKAFDIYVRTGAPPVHIFALPKILYFKKVNPSIVSESRYILDSKSFLTYNFLGYPVSDLATATASYQMINIRSLKWDDLALETAGVDESQLPALEEADYYDYIKSSVAREVGVPEKTPLVLSVFDGAAMIYGLTGGRTGIAVVNMGTTSMFRVVFPSPIVDTENMLSMTFYFYRGTWIPGATTNNGGVVLEYVAKLLGVETGKIFESLSGVDVDGLIGILRDTPIAVPVLYRERLPMIRNEGLSVIGIRPSTSQASFLVGIIEGLILLLSPILDFMSRNNIRFDEVRLAGKVTSLPLVQHLYASLTRRPVRLSVIADMTHFGNALMAANSLGYLKKESIIEIIDKQAISDKVIMPDERLVDIVSKRLDGFKKLLKLLYE